MYFNRSDAETYLNLQQRALGGCSAQVKEEPVGRGTRSRMPTQCPLRASAVFFQRRE